MKSLEKYSSKIMGIIKENSTEKITKLEIEMVLLELQGETFRSGVDEMQKNIKEILNKK